MNITLCIDEGYVMPAVVLLKSIGINGGGNSKTIYVVSEKVLAEDSRKKLSDVCQNHGMNIHFMIFELDKIWNNGKVNIQRDYWSLATYLRLFLASILPKDVEKTLYIDCDTIVRKSLEPLWNIDITDYAIAGVRDANQFSEGIVNTLTYDVKKFEYVNAGVLLMNLKYIRDNNVENLFISYICENKDKITYHDQEIINNILYDKKLLLPTKYNAQYDNYKKTKYRVTPNEELNIIEMLRDPVIVHYTWHIKPWLKYCRHPFAKDFRRIKQMTIYKEEKLKDSKSFGLRDKIAYLLYVLHLNFKLRYV